MRFYVVSCGGCCVFYPQPCTLASNPCYCDFVLQVVSDPSLNKSGVYWSWDNTKSSLWFEEEEGALENTVSEEVRQHKC